MNITWTKLRSGEWGLRSTEALNEGEVVWVSRANGSRSKAEVGRQVWAGNGVWLYTKAEAGTPKAEAPKPVPTAPKAEAASMVADWDVDSEIAAERAANCGEVNYADLF